MEDEIKKYYDFEIDENNLPDEKPLWKKIPVVIMGFFLIFLIITGLMGGQWIADIFQGQLISDKVVDFQVEVNDNLTIIFEQAAYNGLLDYYNKNQETEFKACLTGEIKNDIYFIKDLYYPQQTAQFNKVVYTSCNQETIVSLHSHPYKHCLPSEQDLITAESYKEQNPKAIMAILCEPARLTFYAV